MRRRLLPFLILLSTALGACGGGEQDAPEESATGDTFGGTTEGETKANETSASRAFALPGEQVFPEGITFQESTGDFFVGSTQDGTVYRGNVNGPDEAEVFLQPGTDGREAVTGMKVDEQGRLFVAGRNTGRAFVYDARSGELIRALETPPGRNLINDVVVTPDAAYFTDSFRPVLFRVPLSPESVGEIESWLDLEETPIEYADGFNLNGIAAAGDGRYLITVHFATGELFRVDTESKEVTRVDLGGETLTTGDGLLLDGRTLYVVQEDPAEVVPVELSEDLTEGEVGEGFSDPSFRFPTTVAKYDDRLLIVNSQLDMSSGGGGKPELPFTVSDVPVPSSQRPLE